MGVYKRILLTSTDYWESPWIWTFDNLPGSMVSDLSQSLEHLFVGGWFTIARRTRHGVATTNTGAAQVRKATIALLEWRHGKALGQSIRSLTGFCFQVRHGWILGNTHAGGWLYIWAFKKNTQVLPNAMNPEGWLDNQLSTSLTMVSIHVYRVPLKSFYVVSIYGMKFQLHSSHLRTNEP